MIANEIILYQCSNNEENIKKVIIWSGSYNVWSIYTKFHTNIIFIRKLELVANCSCTLYPKLNVFVKVLNTKRSDTDDTITDQYSELSDVLKVIL